MIPEALDYRHHTTEYWQFEEPRKSFPTQRSGIILTKVVTPVAASPETVHKCDGQEDPTCSASIGESRVPSHIVQLNELM